MDYDIYNRVFEACHKRIKNDFFFPFNRIDLFEDEKESNYAPNKEVI